MGYMLTDGLRELGVAARLKVSRKGAQTQLGMSSLCALKLQRD